MNVHFSSFADRVKGNRRVVANVRAIGKARPPKGLVYEVDKICDKDVQDGVVHYLVRWKGYRKKSWNCASFTDRCEDAIQDYEVRALRGKGGPRHKKAIASRVLETGDDRDETCVVC